MDIIPVIDLKGGVVVRARRGERSAYQPIETPLSPTSAAVDVVAGLISLHPFPHLYAGDLDAIQRQGDNFAALDSVAAAFPKQRLWLDNGCATLDAAQTILSRRPEMDLVLGSESQEDIDLLRLLRENARILLSLDFRGETFLGPDRLLADSDLWPERVIVMTLACVGSGEGPDLRRLEAIINRAGSRKIYAAGGVRGAEDLAELAKAGAAGALVASALHDGRLSSDVLGALTRSAGNRILPRQIGERSP